MQVRGVPKVMSRGVEKMDDWNQSGENAKKEPGHLFERLEGKLIPLSSDWGGEVVGG